MDLPETRYVKVGEVHIAYQTVGEGPTDLAIVPGIFTHVEYQWDEPSYARFLRRLASFSRLILFDPRGTGLSDRAPELPIFEEQLDDLLAVLDAAGSERAVVMGVSQGGPLAILFTATHPDRSSGLILYGTYATARRDDEYPWGRSREWLEEYFRQVDEEWGTGYFLPHVAPTLAGNEEFRRWWARFERLSSSPGNALAAVRVNTQIDVRHVLPTVSVPTLVLQRRNDAYRNAGHARYLAERIPGARLVDLPGVDHLPYVGEAEPVLDAIGSFLAEVRPRGEAERILTTVLFADLVGSTERAAELGDRRWAEHLERYLQVARRELDRHRGREVDAAGDGFLATFDGPARAVRCAVAVRNAARSIGLETRCGLHTGEVELVGQSVRGIAVHLGARIAAAAAPGEVLTSSTVRDLVAGSGIAFEDRGERALKGLPERWRLFSVVEA
jgi:class 3 adenylate cyclase